MPIQPVITLYSAVFCRCVICGACGSFFVFLRRSVNSAGGVAWMVSSADCTCDVVFVCIGGYEAVDETARDIALYRL